MKSKFSFRCKNCGELFERGQLRLDYDRSGKQMEYRACWGCGFDSNYWEGGSISDHKLFTPSDGVS